MGFSPLPENIKGKAGSSNIELLAPVANNTIMPNPNSSDPHNTLYVREGLKGFQTE